MPIPQRVRDAPLARLATVRPDGRPHLVPVVFAVGPEDTLLFAVDGKPKRTVDLQRLRNITHEPRVSLLVDEYGPDWTQLWWVRLDGRAEIVRDEPRRSAVLRPLVEKYAQYRAEPPAGPAVVVAVDALTSWSARDREGF